VTTLRIRRRQGAILPCEVRVPGSKSIANRALVCAHLANTPSRLGNVPAGDDVRLLSSSLREFGTTVTTEGDWTGIEPRSSTTNPSRAAPDARSVDAGLGGTTARFLLALAAATEGTTEVRAGRRLLERPMQPLLEALEHLGAVVDRAPGSGVLARITGGELTGGEVSVSTAESSQFTSALMMIGPTTTRGLRIRFDGEVVSRSYLTMTAAVMRAFGADVDLHETGADIGPGGYTGATMEVEADWSSAAYPLLAGVLTGREVSVPGLIGESLQGDSRLLGILHDLGCRTDTDRGGTRLLARAGSSFPGLELDLRDQSDLVPALAVALAGAATASHITGIGFIRSKESNRIDDLAREVATAGVTLTPEEDGLIVVPGIGSTSARLDPRDDHRLAMAFPLLTLIGDPAAPGLAVEVQDAECVSKSWPGYWQDMSPFFAVDSLPS